MTARRVLALTLALFAILVAVTVGWFAPRLEERLDDEVRSAVTSLAVGDIVVATDGRDVTLTGTVTTEAAALGAKEVASSIEGVRTVASQLVVIAPPPPEALPEPIPTPEPTVAPEAEPTVVAPAPTPEIDPSSTASTIDQFVAVLVTPTGGVNVSGTVADDASRQLIVAAASGATAAVDRLSLSGLAADEPNEVLAFARLVDLVGRVVPNVREGTITLAGTAIGGSITVTTPDIAAAVEAEIESVDPNASIIVAVPGGN